ncbi:MAG: hypothetical protein NTY09_08980 [bacterium]|nr:hypothetical protein [bacterium]
MRNFKLFILVSIMLLPAFLPFSSALAKEGFGSNNNDNRDRGDWQFRQETVSTNGEVQGDVFTIDVPEGWDFDSEIDWLDEELPMFTVYFVMNDQDGTSLLGVLPMTNYVWFTDPWLESQMPEGYQYSGSTTVLEPRDPSDYLEELLIPYLEDIYRDQARIRNFEIVDVEDRDDLADLYVRMMGVEAFAEYYDCSAAVAHVEYNEDGIDVEEQISAIIGVHSEDMIGLTSWTLENVVNWTVLLSVVEKAPVGQLDEMDGVYVDILSSMEWNQDFMDDYWAEHDEAWQALQDQQD